MPYTKQQCKYFGWAESQGKKVPSDWRKYCTKEAQKKAEKKRGHKK